MYINEQTTALVAKYLSITLPITHCISTKLLAAAVCKKGIHYLSRTRSTWSRHLSQGLRSILGCGTFLAREHWLLLASPLLFLMCCLETVLPNLGA